MMKRVISKQYGIVLALVCVCAFVIPHDANAEYESVSHCVHNYGGSGECSGDNSLYSCGLSSWESIWDYYFDSSWKYDYDQVEQWQNNEVNDVDWEESGLDEWDPSGTDFADAIMFAGHGGRQCSSNYKTWIKMGNSSGDCYVHLAHKYGGTVDTVWANTSSPAGDANVLVSKACQSAHYCVWNNNQFTAMRASTQFQMFNGFHGIHGNNPFESYNFQDYLDTAEYNNLGEDWVIYLTDYIPFVGQNCGVSVLYGSSRDDYLDAAYYSGFRDFHTVGSGAFGYGHVNYCDPDGGEQLGGGWWGDCVEGNCEIGGVQCCHGHCVGGTCYEL